MEHGLVKYLNNVIEADHGKLKRMINHTLGFHLSIKQKKSSVKNNGALAPNQIELV